MAPYATKRPQGGTPCRTEPTSTCIRPSSKQICPHAMHLSSPLQNSHAVPTASRSRHMRRTRRSVVALLAAPPLVRSPQRAPASSVTRQARRFRRPPTHGMPRLASWVSLSSSDPCACPFRGSLPSSPSEVRVDPHPVLHQSVRLRVLALLHGLLPCRAPPHIIQQYLQIVHLGIICTRPAARIRALDNCVGSGDSLETALATRSW